MSAMSLPTLIPDTADTERNLLAKLLGSPRSGTALASAARTASTLSSNLQTLGYRGVIVYLNVTAASGTGGLTPRLFGVDPVTLAVATSATASTAVTTVGLRIYHFGQGCGGASGGTAAWASVGVLLGSQVAFQVLHGDASSYTYSLTWELIP